MTQGARPQPGGGSATLDPPRLAERLLHRVVGSEVAGEGLAGDLREEYAAARSASSRFAADRWYWRAVITLGAAYTRERARRFCRNIRGQSATPAPRRGDPMSTFLQDLRFAIRGLLKSYGFTAVAVLTLAFGIGANTAMFSTLNAAVFRPLPFPDADRLVMGRATFDGGPNPVMAPDDFYDYRDQATTLESFAAITGFTMNYTITGADEAEQLQAGLVSWDLFPTLGIDPQAGRQFAPAEGEDGAEPVAIISNRYWQRRFGGSSAAIGSPLVVNGEPRIIVGVMPAGFHFLFDVDLWMPMTPGGLFGSSRRFHNWLGVGRLADGMSLDEAQSEADVISRQLAAEYPETNTGKALLLTDLHEVLVEQQRGALFLLMSAVGLVLLIACGNVANLLLARGSARRGELAVRAALGASRARIVSLLLTESVVIAMFAGVGGIVLAAWLQSLFLQLMPLTLLGVIELGLDASMLATAVLIALATSLVFGTLPALHGAPRNVSGNLRAAGRTGGARGGHRLRSGLVVAQVALSVVLLIGSGLLIRSFAGLQGTPLGFDDDNLLTAEVQLGRADYPDAERVNVFFAALLEEVRALPGVTAAGLISQLPIRDPGNNIYVYDASKPPLSPTDAATVYTRVVLPGYFEAMKIPLLAGRRLADTDVDGSPNVMLIDEQVAAEIFADQDPLGQRLVIDFGEPVTAEIVGVVGNVRVNDVRYADAPAMYFSQHQFSNRTMRLAIRTAGEPESLAGPLRALMRRLDPELPLSELDSMEALIGASVAGDRLMAGSLTLFASVALLLAVVGLYGVLAYYVAQRRREIGIRLAIGAPNGRILGWIVGRGMVLVAVGLAVGVGASFGAARFIESLLFGIEPVDPATFAGVSAFFALIALIACALPAWRAMRVDPVTALSSD